MKTQSVKMQRTNFPGGHSLIDAVEALPHGVVQMSAIRVGDAWEVAFFVGPYLSDLPNTIPHPDDQEVE